MAWESVFIQKTSNNQWNSSTYFLENIISAFLVTMVRNVSQDRCIISATAAHLKKYFAHINVFIKATDWLSKRIQSSQQPITTHVTSVAATQHLVHEIKNNDDHHDDYMTISWTNLLVIEAAGETENNLVFIAFLWHMVVLHWCSRWSFKFHRKKGSRPCLIDFFLY